MPGFFLGRRRFISPPIGALAQREIGGRRFGCDLGRVHRGELAGALENTTVDDHRVHIRRLCRRDQHVSRITEYAQIDILGRYKDYVGPLSRLERADLVRDAHRACALDRCELEHATGGKPEFALALSVLDILDEFHDPEHVGVAGEFDRIDGESDWNAGSEQVRGLREPEADAQLAGWRQADRGSRRLNRRDLVRRQHDTMDDLHVVGEQPCFSNRIDLTGGAPRPAAVDRDRHTKRAGAFDLGFLYFWRNGGCWVFSSPSPHGEAAPALALLS